MANYKMQEYINRLEYPIEHKYAAQKRLFSHIKANTDPREQDT
jgi:phage-related protein